ncbi:MAG: hypothetical protein O3A73_10070, partial [Proteobacteria bacterium]|nr:hypothetical protein [Pseudomonadota bacterium]
LQSRRIWDRARILPTFSEKLQTLFIFLTGPARSYVLAVHPRHRGVRSDTNFEVTNHNDCSAS